MHKSSSEGWIHNEYTNSFKVYNSAHKMLHEGQKVVHIIIDGGQTCHLMIIVDGKLQFLI